MRRAEPRSDERGALHALAAARTAEGAWIALASPSGLLCSRDFGRTFAPAAGAQAAGMPDLLASLAITSTPRGVRLWAAGAAGALWASDDGGASFRCVKDKARVLRLASDGAGALVVLARGHDGAAIALRSDDGERFESTVLPVAEIERVQDLQIAGDALLCCRRAPLPQLSVRSDGAWSDVAHGTPPALLLDEGDGVRVYFWVAGERGAQLVRTELGAAARVEIVADLPREAGAPLQLCGHHQDGVTTLHAGTERAWYRVVVQAEGAPR